MGVPGCGRGGPRRRYGRAEPAALCMMWQGRAQSRCRCGRRRPVLSARCSSCDMGLSACDTACTYRRSDGRSFSTKASAAVSSSTTSSVPAQTCAIPDPRSIACKAGRVRELFVRGAGCPHVFARAFFHETDLNDRCSMPFRIHSDKRRLSPLPACAQSAKGHAHESRES